MARPVLHDSVLRSRLLDVTAELVDREGPARVALRQIAAAAGTSTTAVYSLFGGKSELLSAVIDSGFASFGDAQRAAADGGLRALGIAYRAWALAHPALYRLMFGGALASYAECAADPETADGSMEPLRRSIAAAQAEGSMRQAPLEDVAAVIWAQVHGLVSLELAAIAPPDADWDAAYNAGLDAVSRAWAP
ncbi:TetR-like C-terminal domain-containing protein [Sinomonas sp. B1-1]|uniref:TetR-like C-terminal domain-containing protein n=1 Tax=Sinomonas sp. B1-1 TaxID=3141454 RepID=UPI003D2D6AB3